MNTVHGDITWTRPAGCESNACVEWSSDATTVRLRSSRRPDEVAELDVDEFWALIDAAVNGEVVTLDG